MSHMRKHAKLIMAHKYTTFFIIGLVSVYTLIVFAVIAMDDLIENDEEKVKPFFVMLIIELVILIIF